MGRSSTYVSPQKTIRNMKRMIHFLKSKSKPEPESQQKCIPTQNTLAIISISLKHHNLAYFKNEQISIRPKKIYHPTVINACNSLFGKHPDKLINEEILKFNQYRKYKLDLCDPLEANPIYLPIGGLRKCLICSNLT